MQLTKDLVVFITGGASGLGEATVRYLHAKGCKLGVVDLNQEGLDAIQNELKENIICLKCDVTKEEDVKNAIDETIKAFGTIHVAIPCAGGGPEVHTLPEGGLLDINLFKFTLDLNLMGAVYVAKYAAAAMAKNEALNDKGEKGVIVFVSSVAAEEGIRGHIAYSASKGALNGMVVPMARDLGRFGVRVLAVAPSIFDTPPILALPQEFRQVLNAATPLNRTGHPEEFAHFVGACIENTYVNGVHLRLDGGAKYTYM